MNDTDIKMLMDRLDLIIKQMVSDAFYAGMDNIYEDDGELKGVKSFEQWYDEYTKENRK